jgi:Flp pilus assembly protein TadB
VILLINLVEAIIVVTLFGLAVFYNRKILVYLNKTRMTSEGMFIKTFGAYIRRANVRMERKSALKPGSWVYKVDRYFKSIIVNLNMEQNNVTPVGLLTFILSISFSLSLVFAYWSSSWGMFLPAFCTIAYMLVVIFRFVSLIAYERKEAEIMDVQDLIAMDVSTGVYNAIQRYSASFHPNMKPFFDEFTANIQKRGYGFQEAMLLLSDRLGENFRDFAQKAILYESKADAEMEDIFSSVVEMNRYRRVLRHSNNVKFSRLRMEFIISTLVIAAYGGFSVLSDPFLANLLLKTMAGKFIILGDVLIVTIVLSYLAAIKAKFV